MNDNNDGRPTLSTVVTASHILELISGTGGATPVTISKKLNLNRSKVHRLLATLSVLDYVEERQDGTYILTFKMFELGNTIPHRKHLIDTAKPSMLRLSQLIGQTVNNGVLYENQVLYIDKVEAITYLKLDRSIGSSDPLHSTSLGKVLLAFLEPGICRKIVDSLDLVPTTPNTITDSDRLMEELGLVREKGYALDRQELSRELNCVAAPVFDTKGRVCSAISVSGPADRFTVESAEAVVPDLKATVREITRMIAG